MLPSRQTERASKVRTLIKRIRLYYKGYICEKQGSDDMEIVIVAWLGSVIVSVLVGNIIGIYYLKVNDNKWANTFDEFCSHISEIIFSHKQ